MAMNFFRDGKNILVWESDDGYIISWIYQSQWIAHFQKVILLVCKLCINKADLKQKQAALKVPNTSEVT